LKVPYKWLKKYVDFDLSPQELADKFNVTGTRVETLTFRKATFSGVLIGKILKIEHHPKREELLLCEVDIGKENLSIICGANNISEGDIVPVAITGAKIKNVILNEKEINGVISQGMLCSPMELDLGEEKESILILDKTFEIGGDLAEALEINDYIYDFEITPIRPDCLGLIGIAREVAAFSNSSLKIPEITFKEKYIEIDNIIQVIVEDKELCPRYSARVVENIKMRKTPLWLQVLLKSIGIRSINYLADISNFVMWETGQPLHIFDFEKIGGKKVIVRRARQGEKILNIDGKLRYLDPSILVIADEKDPIAIAGVMGGLDSEVTYSTKSILIESANFNQVNIMRTSKRLKLRTEASNRFEKGLDPNLTIFSLNRCAQLIINYMNANIISPVIDVYPNPVFSWNVKIRPKRANKIIGVYISKKKMKDILRSLELEVKEDNEEVINVKVPTFRMDLRKEIDLVEEIARLHNYDNIPSILPIHSQKGGLNRRQNLTKKIKETIISQGFYEVWNFAFDHPNNFDLLCLSDKDSLRNVIKLKNPISKEHTIMRTTLITGLLKNVNTNMMKGENSVQIFELAKVFKPKEDQLLPDEPLYLGVAACGLIKHAHWLEKVEEVDFYLLKGLLEKIFESLCIKDLKLLPLCHPSFHPGKSAKVLIGSKELGKLGQIHPNVQNNFQIDLPVFVMELNCNILIEESQKNLYFKEIIKHPKSTIDLSIVIDEDVNWSQIADIIEDAAGTKLEELRLFDVYRERPIEKGKKSVAFKLSFRDPEGTLTDREVNIIRDKIVKTLKEKLNAKLRE
jgi:phenylalanyl-tRNA synthetase beta chain